MISLQYPKISLIIPSRDSSRLLAETLFSVFNQILLPHEIILVLDRTTEHDISSIYLFHPFTCVLYDDGLGVYQAMNAALTHATGDYIYFMGAGDRLLSPNSIKNSLSLLVHNSYPSLPDVAVFNVVMHDEQEFPAYQINRYSIQKGFMPCHQGVFFSLKLAKLLGGFNVDFKIAADYDLLLRAVVGGCTFVHYQYRLAYYMGGGISTDGSVREIFKALCFSRMRRSAYRFLFIETLAKIYRKLFLMKLIAL